MFLLLVCACAQGIYGYLYIHDIVGYDMFSTGHRKYLLRPLLARLGAAESKQPPFYDLLSTELLFLRPQAWSGASVQAKELSGH